MKFTLNFLYIAIFLLQESMVLVYLYSVVSVYLSVSDESSPSQQDNATDTGPTVFDKKDFKAADEADALGKLLKDRQKNYEQIIDVLTGVSNKQRLEIVEAYKKKGDLVAEVDKYFSEDMEKHIDALKSNVRDLMRTPGEYLAVRIDDTLGKKGKDLTYMTVLCTSTGDELRSITSAFTAFGETLGERLNSVKDVDLKTFLLYVINDSKAPLRSNAKADDKKTEDLLKSIPSGDKGPCTAEKNKPFYDMMAKDSFNQIKAVAEKFKGDIVATVADKCEGKLASAFTRILKFALKPADYFAAEADAWITGSEDDNIASAAVRIVISRCEIDLAAIKASYSTNYNKAELKDSIFKKRIDSNDDKHNAHLISKLIDGNKR